MALALTETAAKQVKQLMKTQKLENVYLRMGVKGGGCSGLSYSLEFDNEIGPARQEVRHRRGAGGRATPRATCI